MNSKPFLPLTDELWLGRGFFVGLTGPPSYGTAYGARLMRVHVVANCHPCCTGSWGIWRYVFRDENDADEWNRAEQCTAGNVLDSGGRVYDGDR